ncbi:MAG: ORF6C domain-containing protein [Herpetosiphonaceae bacterium]|nr:ORF6C domain-containing protein [Herpetosiphonaceae bacterium]
MSGASTQRIVPFYGDELIAVQQPDGNIFVHFGRLCENLGLSRTGQVRRVQRHEVLTSGLTTIEVQTEGGAQTVQCLRIDLLPLWMAGLHASRVKDDVRPKLVHYQQEAAVVLWQAFKPQIMAEETSVVVADSAAIQQIQQIIDMGYAIARMGEQQLEIQRQQQALAGRLDSAARIIRDVQGHLERVDVRLGVVEERLQPGMSITDEQATEVSNRVKALADLLTSAHAGKNHYQGIFAELYRRFGVSSYKLIPQRKYGPVLAFLEEWRTASTTSPGDGPPL